MPHSVRAICVGSLSIGVESTFYIITLLTMAGLNETNDKTMESSSCSNESHDSSWSSCKDIFLCLLLLRAKLRLLGGARQKTRV